jgi:molybdopterin synthase catalytic subunit
MHPPPHMTHMYPPPHMTHMYPPPHMTQMHQIRHKYSREFSIESVLIEHASDQTHIYTRVLIAIYTCVHDAHTYTHAEFIYILKSRTSNIVSQVMENTLGTH